MQQRPRAENPVAATAGVGQGRASCVQPFLAETVFTLGAMALGTYYLRDNLFGEPPPPPKKVKPIRDKEAVLEEVDQYFKEGGGVQVRHTMRDMVSASFGNELTVSYDEKECAFRIGKIERPKGAGFYASDILAYVVNKIARYLKRDRLEIKKIYGSAIVNEGTRVFANLPGAKLLSGSMGGLSVLLALQTPLGKMTDHFLEEHYPDLTMKNVKIEKGSRSNAPNAVVELGPRE